MQVPGVHCKQCDGIDAAIEQDLCGHAFPEQGYKHARFNVQTVRALDVNCLCKERTSRSCLSLVDVGGATGIL